MKKKKKNLVDKIEKKLLDRIENEESNKKGGMVLSKGEKWNR